jgi:hypothetical protein
MGCDVMSRDMHLPRCHDGIVQTIAGSTTLFTADQMDDMHWFLAIAMTWRPSSSSIS